MQPQRPADDELAGVRTATAGRTADGARRADPRQPNWTWSSDHTAGFVIRRMAQETAVHRWDADDAAGSASADRGRISRATASTSSSTTSSTGAPTRRRTGRWFGAPALHRRGRGVDRPARRDGRFEVTPRARQGRLRDPRRGQRHPARAVAPRDRWQSPTWWATPTWPLASWPTARSTERVTRPVLLGEADGLSRR